MRVLEWYFLTRVSLKIVNEDISTATIVGTTCAILVLLFLIQPLGLLLNSLSTGVLVKLTP